MTLKVPGAIFRDERDEYKTGDTIDLYWKPLDRDVKARVASVYFETNTLDVIVIHDDNSREWARGVPFMVCCLAHRPDVSGAERHKTRGAMDRFAKRFLEHANSPGGTKPGHTVTREDAYEVARQCANRADRRLDS